MSGSWRWTRPGHGPAARLTDETPGNFVILAATQLRGRYAQKLRLCRVPAWSGDRYADLRDCRPAGPAERAGHLQRGSGPGLRRPLPGAARASPGAGIAYVLRAAL